MKDTIPLFMDKIDRQETQLTIRFYYFMVSVQATVKSEQCQQAILSEGSDLQKLASVISWYGSAEQFFLQFSLTGGLFERPNDISKMIDLIDAAGLELQAEYHTVVFDSKESMELLVRQSNNLARGAVYRIRADLLQDVLQGIQTVSPSLDELTFSSVETEAFTQWNMQIIDTVKERYHKQPEKTLAGRRGINEK